MRIAVIGHVRFPIKPPFMGGMEAHCWHLCRGLRARGHDVVLFAAGDSDWGGPVVPLLPEHYDDRFPWHQWHGTDTLNAHLDSHMAAVLPALRDGGFDVIHNNSLHRFPPRFARRDRVPMLTSLHVPPFDVLQRAVADSGAPWARFTTCSSRQKRAWFTADRAHHAHVAPNGIDPADWPWQAQGNGRAVWMGRITPTKGAHLAVAAARRAGVGLTLFGTIEDREYFDTQVAPLLGGEITYGGHLGAQDLAREIGQYSVLVFTPLWDEPFGLVAIEAMSCGLPVAAIENGAIREVAGEAGRYSTADADDLARAITQAMDIPRRVPRAGVQGRFTLTHMLERYENLYAHCIDGLTAPAAPVSYRDIELPAGRELAAQ
ncbi:glycosyltransferase [Sagittula sp. SSi028]|uniref:glycosyltransferase n=1 Tax=Sagittula sp. SSi028 TaxID=3400636 RepID=UPI003AF9F232